LSFSSKSESEAPFTYPLELHHLKQKDTYPMIMSSIGTQTYREGGQLGNLLMMDGKTKMTTSNTQTHQLQTITIQVTADLNILKLMMNLPIPKKNKKTVRGKRKRRRDSLLD